MGHIERALQTTAVGILTLAIEDRSVEINVVTVDGAVEGDCDHLGHLCGIDVSGHAGSVRRAEAVGQLALAQVAVGGPVGILVHSAGVLV